MQQPIASSDWFETTPFDAETSLEKAAQTSEGCQDVTAFFVSFIWLIIFIRSFKNYDAPIPIYKSTKIITTLYPAGYALKYFIDIFVVFIIDAQYPNNKDAQWVDDFIFDPIQKMCLITSNTLFYVSLLLKLNNSFKSSVFRLKKRMLYLLCMLLAIAFLLDITFFATRKIVKEQLSDQIHSNIPFHLTWIKSLYLWFLGIFFIACFVDKLLKFVMIRSRSRRSDSTVSIALSPTIVFKEEKTNLSSRQKEHLKIAVKFVLLHGTAITLMLIQFSGWSLLNFELIKDERSVLWFDIFWSWFWNVVLFINLYTIWLSLPFAKTHYNYVCKSCNRSCLGLCSSLVALRMADEITSSTQRKDESDAAWH